MITNENERTYFTQYLFTILNWHKNELPFLLIGLICPKMSKYQTDTYLSITSQVNKH